MILCITLYVFSLAGYCQEYSLRKISNGDTLYVNYSVALGEMGSVHEGVVLVKKDDGVKATHVIYNFGISIQPNGIIEVDNESFIPMNEDSIKAFFYSFKNNFTILKKEWKLNDEQINFLDRFLKEAKHFESDGFSNAPEYYFIITNDHELVILDRSGKWNKHREFKKVLGLKSSY